MNKILKVPVSIGLFWINIAEADLRIMCGCPADSVKYLIKTGLIAPIEKDGVRFETGPNAILLSDVMLQNGHFSNLSEFPILHMLYKQGHIIPNHPNNFTHKPLLIGTEAQIQAQMKYLYRGNYGLISKAEIMECGIDEEWADIMMSIKLNFAFGEIKKSEEIIDTLTLEYEKIEIRKGVFIKHLGLNQFEISYQDEQVSVDLNLGNQVYESPYFLGYHQIKREYFGVIHSGEGNGWYQNRPCMSSILMFQGRFYLLDAGPNILYSLTALGIGINEIEGVFHTHAHDDHFAGLTSLMRPGHKLKYFAPKLIRHSTEKKLSALLSIDSNDIHHYFDIHDLEFNTWNEVLGLEVKPFYSPHSVDTCIYIFRAMGQDGYRSYAHFADIVSFNVLQNMVDHSTTAISQSYAYQVKREYETVVDVKKIDAAGGMIHGEAADFKCDKSGKIILSHTDVELSTEQMEIGSGSPFGTVDVLASGYQNYERRFAHELFCAYFPEIEHYKINMLTNHPIVQFNPENIILKEAEPHEYVYLILTGTVTLLQSNSSIKHQLSAGILLGELSGLCQLPSIHTYRAASFVYAIKISNDLYRHFVEENNLSERIDKLYQIRAFLQGSWLFGEGLPYLKQNKLASSMTLRQIDQGTILTLEHSKIYILLTGTLQYIKNNEVIGVLKKGDFFGEEQAFFGGKTNSQIKTDELACFYEIPKQVLEDIPIVRWKLFETHEYRKKNLAYNSI